MTQHLFRVQSGALIPTDSAGQEYLAKIKDGETVRADCARVRSPRQNRLYWALIAKVHPQQKEWPTIESLSHAILCGIGHGEVGTSKSGVLFLKASSIAFGNLPQDDFNEKFDRAIALVCEKILPGVSDEDLRREVLSMIGE